MISNFLTRYHCYRIGDDRKTTITDEGRLRAPTRSRGVSAAEKFNFLDSDDHQLATLHQTDKHRELREGLDAGHKPRRTRKRDVIKKRATAMGKRVSKFMGASSANTNTGSRFSKFTGAFTNKRGGGGGGSGGGGGGS